MKEKKQKTKGLKFGSVRIRIFLLALITLLVSTTLGWYFTQDTALDKYVYVIYPVFDVIVILAAVLITESVLRPLNRIYIATKEMRLGHTAARSGIQSKNELGQLSREIDTFYDDVQHIIVKTLKDIAAGEVKDIAIDKRAEDDEIAPALMGNVETMSSLSHDLRHIMEAAVEGNLERRCDTEKYQGTWKVLTEDMNMLLDTISSPLNEVMQVLGCFAVNDFTHLVKGEYTGSFKELAQNVNDVRDNMLKMQGGIVRVAQGDTSKLEEFHKIGRKSEFDYMVPSMVKLMETVRSLVSEVTTLTEEGKAGNIRNTRGDAEKFEGGFKAIIEGFNSTLDTIIDPLTDAASVLSAMSVNDYTSEISQELYKGDFRHLSDAVMGIRNHLLHLQEIAEEIASGDIHQLADLKTTGRRSENDRLVPAFIRMMQSIQNLIDEISRIAAAAQSGDLDHQSSDSGLDGEFKAIIASFNSAFAAMSTPLKEISNVMEETANGSLHTYVTGSYNGKFKVLSDNINNTIQSINGYMSQFGSILAEMERGNFMVEEANGFQGDWVSAQHTLNKIVQNVNKVLSDIYVVSEQVASGSRQVSDGSQNLSQGATEQASSIEQLTASISEISGRTRTNAENASEANRLATLTKKNASIGTEQMREMLKSMNEINESSSSISKIIKVIDDIAFQTNILSLNAAVEAARAGEYGKGFAVVAEEVRNLASRSANAAKETADLIESSVEKINGGMQIADETASALSNIVEDIDRMGTLVSSISDASNEQATGISQIHKGVEMVSNVVQTNSATAEESAAASEELSGQAEYLKNLLSNFTLKK